MRGSIPSENSIYDITFGVYTSSLVDTICGTSDSFFLFCFLVWSIEVWEEMTHWIKNSILNVARFELTTFGFGIQCSTNWATHPYTIPTHCILHIPLASTLTLIMLDMPWILIGQQMTCTKKSGGLQTAPGTRTRSLDIRSVTRCHCARAAMIHHAPTCIISTSILYHHQWYSSIVPTIIYQGRLP